MKITSVELFPIQAECTHPGPVRPDIRSHVVVKLTTDDGLTGWGEITGYPPRPLPSPRVADLGRFLAELLVGRNIICWGRLGGSVG